MSVNKVILLGRLGQEPEMKYTPSGQGVVNFSMATSESWKDKGGTKQEKTEWHRIVAWGALADICNNYLHKGSQVYVEGKLTTRSWDDKDGNKRYATEVQASTVQFLDGVNQQAPAEEPQQNQAQQPQRPQKPVQPTQAQSQPQRQQQPAQRPAPQRQSAPARPQQQARPSYEIPVDNNFSADDIPF